MGSKEANYPWVEAIGKAIKKLDIEGVEAVIVFGSAVRSGLSPTSDIDVMIISNIFNGLSPFERVETIKINEYRIQFFKFSYDELYRMFRRGNTLAISVLAEGQIIQASNRIKRLMEKASEIYQRKGRIWIKRKI